MDLTEAQLSKIVCGLAIEQGWVVFRLPINRTVRPVKNASGYPDLTLARDGEVLWIELKQEDGKLTPEQRMWQEALPAYHVIRPGDLETGRLAELLG